jgi:large subunit ribosomal protein L25
MHLDFMRVSDEEILRMHVPIHYTGESESPAGKASGVVIQHLVTEIEIAALPGNLPSFLDINLSQLKIGDVVMLSDIQLPEGVQIPALGEGGSGDQMIANTSHVRESQGPGVAAALEGQVPAEDEKTED